MEQLGLFDISAGDAFEIIRPALAEVMENNWADLSLLTYKELQNYSSVLFDGSVVARIKDGNRPYIELPNRGQILPGAEKKDNYIRIALDKLSDIGHYTTAIVDSLQSAIDAIPKEYSCCSRYMECSDLIACTNPDKDLAMRCGYRKVLRSGKVFYGKNRNID